MEGLQSLTLKCMHELGREGISALRRATGLTHLRLSCHELIWGFGVQDSGVRPEELGLALSGMSRLQALRLDVNVCPSTSCYSAIGLLTALTSLEVGRGYVTNADVEACLNLKKLRVVSFWPWPHGSCDVTPETLVAMAKLPELTKLHVNLCCSSQRVSLKNEILAVIRPARHAKGWPALNVYLGPQFERG
jgi:hypothetical protein